MLHAKVCLYLPNIATKNNIFMTCHAYYPVKWWTSSSESALLLGDLMMKNLPVKLLHWQTTLKPQFMISFVSITCLAQSPICTSDNKADLVFWIKEIQTIYIQF